MKKITIAIISFFLTINITNALELTCPTIASPNETITCKIEDREHIGLKTNYSFDKIFNYYTSYGVSWKKYYDNINGFVVGNILDETSFIYNLELKVSENVELNKEYKVELTNIEATNKNYELEKIDNITKTIKIVSNDNTLKNLKVKDHTITPSFDKNITSYKVTTKNDKVIIEASPNDPSATIEGNIGEQYLEYGVNNLSIKITSPKGESKTYYLYITREYKEIPKNSDFTLKDLSINKGKIEFNKNTFLYETTVDNNVENIEVKATPNSDKAIVKIEKPEILLVGKNIISIIVTAEDGTIGKYIIEVTKKEKPSNDATIKNIIIKNYSLDFKSDTYNYNLEILNEKKLNIKVILSNENAKYKISGNNNLKDKSTITIKVTAEDGTINNYKIKITKKDPTNSASFFNKFKITPIIIFIILIISIIILKTTKKKHLSKDIN